MTVEPDMEKLLASIRKAIDADIGGLRKPQGDDRFAGSQQRSSSQADVLREDKQYLASTSHEIAELRNKISRTRIMAEAVQEQASLSSNPNSYRAGFADILGGQQSPVGGQSIRREPSNGDAPRLRPAFDTLDTDNQDYPNDLPTYHQGYVAPSYEPEVVNHFWEEQSASHLPAVQQPLYHENHVEPVYQPELPLMSDNSAQATSAAFNQLADTLMARAMGERSIEDVTYELLKGMLKNWLDLHLPNMVERLVREEIERVARRGR